MISKNNLCFEVSGSTTVHQKKLKAIKPLKGESCVKSDKYLQVMLLESVLVGLKTASLKIWKKRKI